MPDPQLIADRFEVVRPLGRGAFAHTLLARDVALGRLVALKVLHPRTAADAKAYELFEREAAVLKELRHPGIPVIHLAFKAEWEGAAAAFLAMEYIEGASLADSIADGRHLDAADVLALFVELLGVLEYLHSRVPPVLHRDIKPANLIVRPGGSPALVDFGAVRNVFRTPDDSGSTVVGTYGYMPYEQYMGQAGPTSDLYALAATFLHLVTGRPPPEFMSDAGRIEVPAALSCGEPLRGVLARMLRPDPSERFPSAGAARDALIGRTSSAAAVVPASGLALSELGPAPRPLTGNARALLKRVSYSTWQLMNSDGEPGVGPTVVDAVLVVFFSAITAGVMPAIFLSRARSRKRRIKMFLTRGLPAVARVVDTAVEQIEFGARLSRVRYEFDADGRRRIGTDRVLPELGNRWLPGTELRVLYLRDADYDSVIVGSA